MAPAVKTLAIDANGNVTVASSLDYETTTSYTITLTASDGSNSTQETITINVSDVDEFALALSTVLHLPLMKDVSSGTQVATSTLTQQDSASVTYTLSGTDSDKFAISSDFGVITTLQQRWIMKLTSSLFPLPILWCCVSRKYLTAPTPILKPLIYNSINDLMH